MTALKKALLLGKQKGYSILVFDKEKSISSKTSHLLRSEQTQLLLRLLITQKY